MLTLDVPYSVVNAHAGDTMYSVHSSTFHYTPPAGAANVAANILEQVDQTAPFTYVVGTPRQYVSVQAQRLTRKPSARNQGSGSTVGARHLPATGVDGGWLAFGVAAIAIAAVAWRKVRRTA